MLFRSRSLFDACYSVDNEQEENEKKKVCLNILHFHSRARYPYLGEDVLISLLKIPVFSLLFLLIIQPHM